VKFWADSELVLKKKVQLAVLPAIPETGWRAPTSFPNIGHAAVLAIDTETKELDFDTHGPGWARGRGHIVGFSVAVRDHANANEQAWYFPLRHEVEPEHNIDPTAAFAWLRWLAALPMPKVFANALYDIGWLGEEGIAVNGPLHDVQFAEALIDEKGFTNLDYLAGKYGKGAKATNTLYQWLWDAYGGGKGSPGPTQRANLYRAPPRLVGPYGEADAALPLSILDAQAPIMHAEGTFDLYRMECGLVPLLVEMRRQGVAVDVDRAEQLAEELSQSIVAKENDLMQQVGFRANVSAPTDVKRLMEWAGVDYPRTAEGNPSFRKEWLAGLEHPVGDWINEIRGLYKVRDTFVKGYILEGNVKGRIHCQFHPLRGDEGGASTGRFASSGPNLQNIPVRTAEGKKVREIFVPFAGHVGWRKYDYSQIEYRMLAHNAVNEPGGNSADVLRETYNADPTTDYHDVVQANVKRLTDITIERRPIKNINFGLLYGQTEKALAFKAGFTPAQAKEIFAAYHRGAPYAKATMAAIASEVQTFGYVRTILNRRTRFDLWEPAGYGQKGFGLPYRQALGEYGYQIQRAYAYRGVNYKLQGSAADIIKAAMLRAYQSGVFDVIGYPLLQVHDELDFSKRDESPQTIEAFDYLAYVLENSTPCRVPIKVDFDDGANWGKIG
jgi:DNA polymerase-1